MYSPARAILWQIFRRNQWGFVAAVAYLLFAIASSHLLTPYARAQWGQAGVEMVGLYLGAPCALILVLIIAAFCLSGSQAVEATPPAHMLVLPITARRLVAVPMIAGSAVVVVIWLIVAQLVLRPADVPAPLLWPAAVLVLFLAIFQALAWTPFTQKWIQGILTVAAGAGTFYWVLGGMAFGFARFGSTAEPFVATGSVAALVPLAYVAALSGVRMTRRGDSYDWRLWSRLMAALSAWRKPSEHPFSSARAAQIWLECRSVGWYPPLITVGVMSLMLFMLLTDPTDMDQTWKFLGIFMSLPLFMASMAGCALGNVNGLSSTAQQGQFLFVRPLSSVALVRDKLWMAALSTLACWAAILPFVSLFFFRPGFIQAVVGLAQSVPLWKLAIGVPLAMLMIVIITWKQLVEGFWIALTGRAWLINVITIGMVWLVFVAVGGGVGLNLYPEYQATAAAVGSKVVMIGVILKLVVAACVLTILLRGRLLPASFSLGMFGGWCLIVAGLAALVLWKVPPGLVPVSDLLGAIVLVIPFSRLMAMPLALEWNRHR